MRNERRNWLVVAVAGLAAPWLVLKQVSAQSSAPKRVVKITAQRFQFSPASIGARAGETLELQISSLDFVHGLSIPDLKLRADLPPQRLTTLVVKFDKPGTYDFLCDNFCGDHHEDMSGKFVVSA